jgi:hypothetical protein
MQCQCVTTKGTQCSRKASQGKYCFQHQQCKKLVSAATTKPLIPNPPSSLTEPKLLKEKRKESAGLRLGGVWQTSTFCDYFKTKEALEKPECYPIWVHEDSKDDFNKSQLRYLASVVDPSLKLNVRDKDACAVLSKYGVSESWYRAQQKYLRDLPINIQNDIFNYSHKGDAIINDYLRGQEAEVLEDLKAMNDNYDFPFSGLLSEALTEADLNDDGIEFMNEVYEGDFEGMLGEVHVEYFHPNAIKKAFQHLIYRLNEIIINSPAIEKDLIVYRGVKDRSYLKEGEEVQVQGLISTTFNFQVALDYAYGSGDKQGTVLAILLPAGSHGLVLSNSMYQNESEVILPTGTTFLLEQCHNDVPVAHMRPESLRYAAKHICDPSVRISLCNVIATTPSV